MNPREKVAIVVGALIAVLCQLLLAPNIRILDAMPNFILAYVIAISVASVQSTSFLIAFLLGLIYDLLGSGPVGAMALICVAIMALSTLATRALGNETLVAPLLTILASCLIAEISYGFLMVACGVDVSLLDAVIYRGLPSGLYDTVIAILAFILAVRFIYKDRETNEMKIIDSSVD